MAKAAQIMKQDGKGLPGEPYCTVCWWSSVNRMKCGDIQIENSAVCVRVYREIQMYMYSVWVYVQHGVEELRETMWGCICLYKTKLGNTVKPQALEVHIG